MADRYWVGGSVLGEWTPTNTLPWRSTAGASFSGSQSGNIVTFSNLQGTIAVGHYVYVSGYANTTIASNLVFNPNGTSGSFRTAASRTISETGMCTHSSNTGLSVPVAADSVFFTAGSSYLDGYINQSAPSPTITTITNLNMNGFRGAATNFGYQYDIFSLVVTGTITWPYNTEDYLSAYIDLRSTTTINNNGNTTINYGDTLYGVSYQVNGIIPPDNIIGQEVLLRGTVNLSNRIITAGLVSTYPGTTLTPGTSKLITQAYYAESVNALTLYDVEGLKRDGAVYFNTYLSGLGTLVINNSLTIPTTEPYAEVVIGPISVKNFKMQASDLTNVINTYVFNGNNSTITKTGGGSVMIQATNVAGGTFLPANTFFTVAYDFSAPGMYGNTNLRPSPSPLNFV